MKDILALRLELSWLFVYIVMSITIINVLCNYQFDFIYKSIDTLQEYAISDLNSSKIHGEAIIQIQEYIFKNPQ